MIKYNKKENQSKLFLSSDADKWYLRNQKNIYSKKYYYENELVFKVLSNFKKNINKILQVGCSNGFALKNLCDYFDACGNGVDFSTKAINDGNNYFKKNAIKNIKLDISLASSLPFKKLSFDLLCFGFCFYLIDRDLLNKSIKEANRVLKKGGFLVIHDFDPGKPIKKLWGHNKKIYIYKEDYSKYFKKDYYKLYKKTYSELIGGEKNIHFATSPENRVSVQILFKEA